MKYLKTLTTLSFLFCFVAFSFAQTREIGNFNQLKASSSVTVKLIKGDEPRIEYKMIKGSADRLITKVEGGKLIVKIKNKLGSWGNNASAKVKVYYTELDKISVSAGASVKSDDPIYATDLDINVSSGSSADLEVDATRVRADASSGASLQLEGKSDKGNFDASSGATIRGAMMVCDYVKADVSSGASIDVHANKYIKAEASSGGSIRYKGDADDRDIDKGWSGSISRM